MLKELIKLSSLLQVVLKKGQTIEVHVPTHMYLDIKLQGMQMSVYRPDVTGLLADSEMPLTIGGNIVVLGKL